MKIQTNLTSQQRVQLLNDNNEDLKMDVYFVGGHRDAEIVIEIISTLTDLVNDDNFYSNFLNDFSGVDTDDLISTICEDRERLSDNSGNDLGEINHENSRKYLPSSMR